MWQSLIAHDQSGYDRQTSLHDMVLERQAIFDALQATDEAEFRQALNGITDIDVAQTRDALASALREREQGLGHKIHEATDAMMPPPFLRVEHPTPHLWIVHVPFYTDIADIEFVHAFQTAIERVWQVRDGAEEFRVQLTITAVSATELHGQQTAPQQGDPLDLQAHIARFPQGGGILTTGANSTHVLAGRCIVLAPHDLAPHVLGHEFGHVLGFRDVYFRGYRDLGADGCRVMEVVADPEDIMGNPGSGPVLRRHFTRLIDQAVTWACLVGLAIGIGVSYGNSFGVGFYFDDTYGIVSNPALRSLRNIPSFFTDPFTLTALRENVDVRPVLVVTYALNYAISGLEPWSYHVVNVLFHGITAVLVFIIVRDHLWWPAADRGPEGAAQLPAAAAALIFALAPLNSQPLLYMCARSALLCVTFYLGAFLALLRRRWTLGAVLCALALLTKAIAVTLPAMLLLYDVVYRDRTRYPTLRSYLTGWRRLLLPVLLPGLIVAAYLVYRALLLPAWAAQTRQQDWVTSGIWFVSQWSALLYYVRLFLWPDGLSVDHDFPYTARFFMPRAWASLLVLLTWVGLALRGARRYPHVLFATLWFFVTLAPESSFAPLAEVINDHRPYIATTLGLSVLLTWVLYQGAALLSASLRQTVFVVTCCLLGLPAVVVNHYQSWRWSDALRLWEYTVATSPNNGRAWMNLGLQHMQRGNLTATRTHFERARTLTPGYAYVYMNLSILEAHEGHFDRALAAAHEAVRLAPGLPLAHFYYGQVLKQTGRTAEAARAYQQAVELDPRYRAAEQALARLNDHAERSEAAMMQAGLDALYTRREADAAAAQFRRVLVRNPTHYGATFQRAMALDGAGKRDEARPLWERVLQMAEGYHDQQTADTARARLGHAR